MEAILHVFQEEVCCPANNHHVILFCYSQDELSQCILIFTLFDYGFVVSHDSLNIVLTKQPCEIIRYPILPSLLVRFQCPFWNLKVLSDLLEKIFVNVVIVESLGQKPAKFSAT